MRIVNQMFGFNFNAFSLISKTKNFFILNFHLFFIVFESSLQSSKPTTWPDNLTLLDIYYFWLAPTLCYELNFPRTSRIRTTFLIRRALEVIVGLNLLMAIVQQYIIPSVVNSLMSFAMLDVNKASERLLKLAVPNHLLWLLGFYLIFHSALNTLGELLQFADR